MIEESIKVSLYSVSENDLEIVGEQSGPVDSTLDASGGNEVPDKKTKITLTEEQETFTQQFNPTSPSSPSSLMHVHRCIGSHQKKVLKNINLFQCPVSLHHFISLSSA